MPEFDKPYTYGIGKFIYSVQFSEGAIRIYCNLTGYVSDPEAVRYQLSEVTKQESFRYL